MSEPTVVWCNKCGRVHNHMSTGAVCDPPETDTTDDATEPDCKVIKRIEVEKP